MSEDLTRRAEDLDKTPAADYALTTGLAALQLVPLVGGFIATYFSEFVPMRKQQRLTDFVQDLARELDALEERSDAEYVKTTEFQHMFEDAMERVQAVKSEGKLGYWAALLAGVAATDRPKPSDRERMIDTLDGLRPTNLRLLYVIATTSKVDPYGMASGVAAVLSREMPDVPEEDARRDWGELERAGLVGNYPSGIMTAAGAGNLTVRLTQYGREFVRLLHIDAGDATAAASVGMSIDMSPHVETSAERMNRVRQDDEARRRLRNLGSTR